MTDTENNIEELLGDFSDKYYKTLKALDKVHKGNFDDNEAINMAALTLLAQGALFTELASADLRSRSLKNDLRIEESNAYSRLKGTKGPDNKTLTETALAQLILTDPEVQRISKEQIEAEKEYKNLNNIFGLLKEAHLTFRSIKAKQV
jgi:hypothetical protein